MFARLLPKVRRQVYAHLYPTHIAFTDGSTIVTRYPEPKKLIKMPLTLADCADETSRVAWQIRRRGVDSAKIDSSQKTVKFNHKKYIKKK